MMPQPLYDARDLHPAYQLRYGWSAWPQSSFPPPPSLELQQHLAQDWEHDGIRRLESVWSDDLLQVTFSAKPDVAPVLVTARAKGRLEHAWRTTANERVKFSRKVALRTIGDTTREAVEAYVLNQVPNASFADPRFASLLERFTRRDPLVDLALPTETHSGRYWYNLHLVLVTDGRYRVADEMRLTLITDSCFQIAKSKGYSISVVSVMPDHLHAALRGRIDHSPQDIALAFLNNLAYHLGQVRIWSDNYYVGTFSDMGAVRRGA